MLSKVSMVRWGGGALLVNDRMTKRGQITATGIKELNKPDAN